jgi:hypothetical protein
MTFWSIISRVAGTRPAAMMADTAAPAASSEPNETISVFTAGGLRIRRTSAWVMRPSVPSLPTKSPVRSYSG